MKSAKAAKERLQNMLVRDRAEMPAGEALFAELKEAFTETAEKYLVLIPGETEFSLKKIRHSDKEASVELCFSAKVDKLK